LLCIVPARQKGACIGDELPLDGLYEAVKAMPNIGDEGAGGLRVGDGVLFGPTNPIVSVDGFRPEYDAAGDLKNWRDFPIRHIGIVASVGSSMGPQILHASQYDGRSTVWPLGKFKEYPRYARQFGRHRSVG
jgi:hypothetical protein